MKERDEERDEERARHESGFLEEGFSSYEEKREAEEPFGKEQSRKEEIRRLVQEELKKKKGSGLGRAMRSLALVLVGAFLGSLLGFAVPTLEPKAPPKESATARPIEIQGEVNVEKAVAQKVKPAIVGITSVVVDRQQDIFGMTTSTPLEGMGSGVIVDPNGYILTNSHVIRDGKASELSVLLDNKETSYPGKVLWFDRTLDLAIVKVEAKDLPYVALGDSDRVEIGDKAVAIGNPLSLNFQSTLTSGYISGLDRTVLMQNGRTMEGLIQTDAAINSGNSGGALLNSKGELIGINTAKVSGGEGLGFAVPINTAKPVVEKVIATGKFNPVVLGISGINVDRYNMIASQRTGETLDAKEGVVVMDLYPSLAAEKAGVLRGDVITALDGEKIKGMSALRSFLIHKQEGDEVKLTLLRDGKTLEKTLRLTADQGNE